jgi:hypothetical protein
MRTNEFIIRDFTEDKPPGHRLVKELKIHKAHRVEYGQRTLMHRNIQSIHTVE